MYLDSAKNVKSIIVTGQGAENVIKQSLLGPAQGWQGWVMRLFTMGAGGQSPRHSHHWPHINYVIGGQGTLYVDGKEYNLEQGSAAYISGGLEHQYLSRGQGEFSFICIVPEEGDV